MRSATAVEATDGKVDTVVGAKNVGIAFSRGGDSKAGGGSGLEEVAARGWEGHRWLLRRLILPGNTVHDGRDIVQSKN
jgi:hypothetical protein